MTNHFSAMVLPLEHFRQRYETCGDWFHHEGQQIFVYVSELPDWRYEFLVGIHELVEAALCRHRGISEDTVTAWDRAHPESADPARAPGSPYIQEHLAAEQIERKMARLLAVDWLEYENAIGNLEYRPTPLDKPGDTPDINQAPISGDNPEKC